MVSWRAQEQAYLCFEIGVIPGGMGVIEHLSREARRPEVLLTR